MSRPPEPDALSSDPHYSHENIIWYCRRPYLTVTAMDDDLVER